MKVKLMIMTTAVSLFAASVFYFVSAVTAEEQVVSSEAVQIVPEAGAPAVELPVAAQEVAGPIEVGNKICPVSGENVYEKGEPFKFEHNGKIYNLCCKMCVKDFKADPEKYSKIAEEAAAKDVEEGQDSALDVAGEEPGHEHGPEGEGHEMHHE